MTGGLKKGLHKNVPCHGYFRRGVFVVSGADQKYGKLKNGMYFGGDMLPFVVRIDGETNDTSRLYGNGYFFRNPEGQQGFVLLSMSETRAFPYLIHRMQQSPGREIVDCE